MFILFCNNQDPSTVSKSKDVIDSAVTSNFSPRGESSLPWYFLDL